MQQLVEIISNPKAIVIQSVRRKDQAIVTATLVPLGDIRLEEWGWILSVSHKNNHDQDGLEELSNRVGGQRYPRLYTLDDLKGYADQWQCTEWEDVYQKRDEADLTSLTTTVLAPSIAEEKETIKNAIADQLIPFQKTITESLREHMTTLTEQAETNAQLTMKLTATSKTDTQALSTQTDGLTKKTDEIENKVGEVTSKLDDINEKLSKIIAEGSKSVDGDDVEAIASDIEKKTTSHIEKIAMNQIRLGNGYYKNVNTQSKQSFDLARLLVIIGAGIFVVSMIAFLIPFSKGNTTVVSGIGIAASAIVELIGGLSFLYNKASVQFAHFHLFLDRINRASIAHAMCDSIKEEDRRQEQIILVVQSLLKDDERIKKLV